ncbi:MAG: STAS domain-containing protein [Vicinamibacterales bacterium]
MRITERPFGGAIVLDLRGALAGRRAAESLDTAVQRLCRDGVREVVANLGRVASVDLGGLAALVDAHMVLRRADGIFKLAGITKRIHDLVVITRLLTVFDTYDSVEDALGRMATAPDVVGAADLSSLKSLPNISRYLKRA